MKRTKVKFLQGFVRNDIGQGSVKYFRVQRGLTGGHGSSEHFRIVCSSTFSWMGQVRTSVNEDLCEI